MSHKQQLVLICPLDWGLGHASRVIPMICRYIACGYRVMLGGAGKSADLLKLTFPQLPFIPIPSPVIHYSGKKKTLAGSLLLQLPKMIFSTLHEHFLIRKIVLTHGVNIIVSDNRYGLFCKHAHSIFITHQISPVLPAMLRWAEYPLYLIIRFNIHCYDECWIPDYADKYFNLSGNLSHRFKLPRNALYVGILSRFTQKCYKTNAISAHKYELVIVLSGPEPQLSIINELMIGQALSIPNKTLIISGLKDTIKPEPDTAKSQLTIASHLEPEQFYDVLMQADKIVCRSGYSGIMDLVAIGKSGILVPTPGQTEQEYLAGYLFNKGWFSYVNQDKLHLTQIIKNKENPEMPGKDFCYTRTEDIPINPASNYKYR